MLENTTFALGSVQLRQAVAGAVLRCTEARS